MTRSNAEKGRRTPPTPMARARAGSTLEDHRPKEQNPDPLLTEAEAAAYLSYRPRTLASWRLSGRGPRFAAVSKTSVRYRRSDLDAWIESKLRRSTSDDGEGDR